MTQSGRGTKNDVCFGAAAVLLIKHLICDIKSHAVGHIFCFTDEQRISDRDSYPHGLVHVEHYC